MAMNEGPIRFSANLGFLWHGMGLPDAIRCAHAAGFQAVECHWPYREDAAAVRNALDETGLPMLGLNTSKGREGEFGLSALAGRETEARAAIDQAFDYGARIGARAVHVMAGIAADEAGAAAVFERNLAHACDRAAGSAMTVLIEPLNRRDAPGYFLETVEQAAAIIERVGRPELKIMFDCYHVQIMGGDLLKRFEAVRDKVGHVQIASVPARREPDEGEVAFDRLLPLMHEAGWDGFIGAEYRPRSDTDAGLGWLTAFRAGWAGITQS